MKNPKILIAEDDLSLRTMLCRALEMRGFDVASAEDGKAALELFKNGGFDVVSTDLDMPAMNGLDLTKAILARQPGALVFMFSGNESAAIPFREIGGHSFYPKANPIAYIQTLLAIRTDLAKEAA